MYVSMSQDVCISAVPLVFGTNSVMTNSSKTEVELQSRDLRRFPALRSVTIILFHMFWIAGIIVPAQKIDASLIN